MTKKHFIIILFPILLFSCSEENDFKIDISDIKVDIEIKRLDKDLFTFNPDSSEFYIDKLKNKYGDFLKLYNQRIIHIGSCDDSSYISNLKEFIKWCDSENIQKTVPDKFQNIESIQESLTEAFRHYNYYFPDRKIPDIYTHISAFNESVITAENIIAISLDKYLGRDSEYYVRLQWEKYRVRRMEPEMIPVDVMRAWAESGFIYKSKSDDMLSSMIYQGKIQYFMKSVMPEINDSLLWSYTTKQMDWAKRNEENVWNLVVDQKMLFNTEKLLIKKYTGDSPFTIPLSKTSAPRAAVFVGYKIIESYMKNNEGVTLEDLMETNDATVILAKAKYNP